MKTEDKVKVYLVHSVKGGSGKSAFSLFKAMTLAVQSDNKEKASVLYLDADFKGTATKTLLYGKDYEAFKVLNHTMLEELEKESVSSINIAGLAFSQTYQYHNLNDFFKEHVSAYQDMVVNGGVCFVEGDTKCLLSKLDFIFSSPSAREKLLFQYENDDRVLPLLNIGWYRMRMQQLLQQIVKSGDYQHIVIDMPPGEDEYSRELVKVLESFYAEEMIKLYWYAITTNDNGHLDSEYEDFLQKMQTDKRHKGYTGYIMVYNELKENEFSNIAADSASLAEELRESGSNNTDECFFLVNSYKNAYYDLCRKTVSSEADIFMFEYVVSEEKKLIG